MGNLVEVELRLGLGRGNVASNKIQHLMADLSSFEAMKQVLPDDAFDSAGIIRNSEGKGYAWTDRLGFSPLYIFEPENPLFTSMVAFQLCDITIHYPDIELDKAFLAKFIDGGYSYLRTSYRGIQRLKAGSYITLDEASKEKSQSKPYWRLANLQPSKHPSIEDAARAFEPLLNDAICCDLTPGKRVGVMISGGVDSALLAFHVTKLCRELGYPDPIAFTWMSPPDINSSDCLEHKLVKELAEQLGLQLEYCPTSKSALLESFQEDILTELVHMTIAHEIPVMRRAKALGVSTIFSGWGGDQAVSYKGRGILTGLLRQGRLIEWLKLSLLHVPSKKTALGSLARLLVGNNRMFSTFTPTKTRKIYTKAVKLAELKADKGFDLPGYYGYRKTLEFFLLELGDVQTRVQCESRFAQRYGVRYAYPLMDHQVVEFSASLPECYVYHNGYSRAFIRELLRGKVSEELRLCHKLRDVIRTDDLVKALKEVGQGLSRDSEEKLDPERKEWLDWELFVKDCRELKGLQPGIGRLHRALQYLQVGS